MRNAILTTIAVFLSASFGYAQETLPVRSCGEYEDFRIWLLGSEDLGEDAATSDCGVPQEAKELVDGCTRVIDRTTDDVIRAEAHFNRALGRIVLGDHEGAIADVDVLLPSTTDSDAYDIRGLAHFCAGDLDRAFSDFNASLKTWSENELAFSDRARVHFQRNDLDRAFADATRATEIEDENATAHVLLGAIAEQRGSMKEAAREYHHALTLAYFCDCGEIDFEAVDAAFERTFETLNE